jgi:WD40 repeat protein
MKIRHIFSIIIFLGLLSACRTPRLPGSAAATLTAETPSKPGEGPVLTVTASHTPTSSRTPTVSPTPTASITQKALPTSTASITPRPTPTSPYPIGPGTPLPNPNSSEITTQNISQLVPIFKIVQQNIWQSAASRDGKQLFVATNNGVFVYDRQGQQLAYWPSIILSNLPCETCLSINSAGTRFALTTHRDGKWFVQVYNVFENEANLLLEKPMDGSVLGIVNEAHVAISPDGLLLAYGTSTSATLLIDINNNQTLLTDKGGADAAIFSPDGVYFIVRNAREMRFWKTTVWKNPTSLQLPTADSTYAFSSDGKRLAVAQSDKIRMYALDTLTIKREIVIPTTKGVTYVWKIAFLDEKTVIGYSTRWDSTHTKATVDVGQWNLDTGETLQMASSETDSPDALSALWGASISLTKVPTGPVALGQYSVFRFIDDDQLLINSPHNACWLKLSSGETNCFDDPKFRVLSSQTEAYREIRQTQTTLLQNWKGEKIGEVGVPYPILAVSWNTSFFLVNAKDSTTDLYFNFQVTKLPQQSFPGTLLSYTENADRMVFSVQQKPGSTIIGTFNKKSLQVPYQKKLDFVLKPLAVGSDNRVYFVQQDPGQPQVILKVIHALTFDVANVARLSLPAEPEAMSISTVGTFAFGMKDGSVAIVSSDGLQVASFQAVYTPISAISLTPDGRYLAVASEDGIRIFAVLPEK